jgi:hypothetical protein
MAALITDSNQRMKLLHNTIVKYRGIWCYSNQTLDEPVSLAVKGSLTAIQTLNKDKMYLIMGANKDSKGASLKINYYGFHAVDYTTDDFIIPDKLTVGYMNDNTDTKYLYMNSSNEAPNASGRLYCILPNSGQSRRADIYNRVALENTLEGNYPTLQKALERISRGESTSIAFDREFALSGHMTGLVYSVDYRVTPILYKYKDSTKYRVINKKSVGLLKAALNKAGFPYENIE